MSPRKYLPDRKARIARIWSNRELRRYAPLVSGSVANVSAWKDLDKEGSRYRDYFTNAESYTLTNKSGFRGSQGADEIDLDLEGDLPESLVGAFDAVLNHTTLEHIFDIRTAFRNLCSLSRDLVMIVVPFAQEQHESADYGDYWRFTPTALRRLFQENDLQTLRVSWNEHSNAATYVLAIGSRHADKWKDRLPPPQSQSRHPAAWIGRPRVGPTRQELKAAARRVLSALGVRSPRVAVDSSTYGHDD